MAQPGLSLGLLCLLSSAYSSSAYSPSPQSYLTSRLRQERVWPINGTAAINFPQSSPFGPRLKASSGFRHDFHRGIDIPTPIGTPLYAIDDGIVRIDGEHHKYYDKVVQIQHYDTDGTKYYANYLHLLSSAVEGKAWNGYWSTLQPEMIVKRGDLLGYTDVDERASKPFPHLHFEIRVKSRYQRNCCHPWKYLPTPSDVSESFKAEVELIPNPDEALCTVDVTVSVPPDRLTFNKVQLQVSGRDEPYEFDFCKANLAYQKASILDDPYYKDFLYIRPSPFSSKSFGKNEPAGYTFHFFNLSGGGTARATACDAYGNCVPTEERDYNC